MILLILSSLHPRRKSMLRRSQCLLPRSYRVLAGNSSCSHCACAVLLVYAKRFHGVCSVLMACRQNRNKVFIICTFADAYIYKIVHALNFWLPPTVDGPNAFYLSLPSSVSVQSYVGSITGILDVVDLHDILWDLLGLYIVK